MAADKGLASERDLFDAAYFDEAGRPIGEYVPSALDRLNRLHNESVETARLANLLGRVPYAAAALAAGCVVTVLSSAEGVAAPALGIWTVFVAAAAIAMLRVRRQAVSSAFELLPLRAFALDLNAVLLYAGVAWGAGAFLGVSATADLAGLVLFALGGAAAMGAILRARSATLYFLIPNIAMAAIAAYFGAGGAISAMVVVVSGLVIVAATETFERRAARRAYAPVLSPLTLS